MKENQLEQTLIGILTEKENQWTYRSDLKSEKALWGNLRAHINRINRAKLDDIELTDKEFEELKTQYKLMTQTPFKAAQWLRGENGVCSLIIEREDLSLGKISLELFSNKDIGGGFSSYEVVNQIKPECDSKLRSDVTLLINGLPIIHIELKAESAKDGYLQAFDQIKRYSQAGFFDGIYGSTQIFVVSNKVATKYFARPADNSNESFDRMKKFLFNWRTPNNQPVENLFDFTREVLKIPNAHELVSRFSVLVDDKRSQKFLMVLRPYQIHAINKIRSQAAKHEGGFIWHATGSGKTITSFVATKLLSSAHGVDRTVMILDRTDLDNQTKSEFSKFASEFHTGSSSANVTDNSLIVGIKNQKHLTDSLLSKKNNNTIIISTIQKMSAAIRSAKEQDEETGSNKLEKLRGEHIVFVVDEAHRAVSDEEMKNIKKYLPNSTWFGLTGTPIFEENKKQENGTYAQTTEQQYGDLLHAYTTKNAMDDQSVLDFQIEYFSLLETDMKDKLALNKLRAKKPTAEASEVRTMTQLEKEKLIDNKDFENDDYIESMLIKIFKRSSITEKFKVRSGFPTMSAILTTHSIAQAKRIYKKLQELKKADKLLTGTELDDRDRLVDPDFPRIAITYSLSENQGEMNEAREEMQEIINDYNALYGTNENVEEVDKFNRNVNNRLARKDNQYQKDGKWLDLVIVVDRLLTGFDSPTIQTLYVDRELKYQKLLQAFSRTNRTHKDKQIGMVVTFRKPAIMKENVKAAMRLFSNENQVWNELVPKEYSEIKSDFYANIQTYESAKYELEEDPHNIKKKIAMVKAYQALERTAKAIKSYDDFADDAPGLLLKIKDVQGDNGQIENLKGEIKAAIEDDGGQVVDISQIEFSTGTNAILEKVDSFYINNLLSELTPQNQEIYQKLQEELQDKADFIREPIERAMNDYASLNINAKALKDQYIHEAIDHYIHETATTYAINETELKNSFNEYDETKEVVPYINDIVKSLDMDKKTYEEKFNQKYRSKSKYIESQVKGLLEDKLLPLKGEL